MRKLKINKLYFYTVIFIITIFIFSLLLMSCKDLSVNSESGKNIIITSIIPLAEFTSKVGEDHTVVSAMVSSGANPHTYEPTPSQLEKLSRAKMYIAVGSGIEFELVWLDKIMEMNKDMVLVDCSRGIELLEDPHIWLSPGNAKIMARNIYEVLVKIDPENEDDYNNNLISFEEELDKLDNEIREIFSSKESKKIIVLHPAWSYFASDYGLEQIAIGIEGKEPTPGNMEELINEAVRSDIKVIFASPEFNTKSAEVIALELGGKVVLVSPLAENYLTNLQNIARAFEESMQ